MERPCTSKSHSVQNTEGQDGSRLIIGLDCRLFPLKARAKTGRRHCDTRDVSGGSDGVGGSGFWVRSWWTGSLSRCLRDTLRFSRVVEAGWGGIQSV